MTDTLSKLKIEFRAIPYAGSSHILEYRISPDQDTTYLKTFNVLGLFKLSIKMKYSTRWKRPSEYLNYPGAERYSQENNYNPIFIYDRKDLKFYQDTFKTIGQYFEYQEKEDNKALKEWKVAREKFLSNQQIWN